MLDAQILHIPAKQTPRTRATSGAPAETFWHGTRRDRLDAILREGLLPSRSAVGHTCLARDPAIALLFARLEQSMGAPSDETAPVLIRIDGAALDPEQLVPETGSVDISAYGHQLPGRDKASLRALRDDAQALLEATDCIGTSQVLSVQAADVDLRSADLPILEISDIMDEMASGRCAQAEARALCALLRQETAPAPTLAMAA